MEKLQEKIQIRSGWVKAQQAELLAELFQTPELETVIEFMSELPLFKLHSYISLKYVVLICMFVFVAFKIILFFGKSTAVQTNLHLLCS